MVQMIVMTMHHAPIQWEVLHAHVMMDMMELAKTAIVKVNPKFQITFLNFIFKRY